MPPQLAASFISLNSPSEFRSQPIAIDTSIAKERERVTLID